MKILANDGISESGKNKLEEYGFDVDLTKVSQEQLVDYINNNSVSVFFLEVQLKLERILLIIVNH